MACGYLICGLIFEDSIATTKSAKIAPLKNNRHVNFTRVLEGLTHVRKQWN